MWTETNVCASSANYKPLLCSHSLAEFHKQRLQANATHGSCLYRTEDCGRLLGLRTWLCCVYMLHKALSSPQKSRQISFFRYEANEAQFYFSRFVVTALFLSKPTTSQSDGKKRKVDDKHEKLSLFISFFFLAICTICRVFHRVPLTLSHRSYGISNFGSTRAWFQTILN